MIETITSRIDAITEIPDNYKNTKPPVPRSVKIELTARCDFNCFFCASGRRMRKKADMPFDEFKRLAREMRDAGVEELGLFYLGESFLYHDLAAAVRYAKEVCGYPYVFLTTNGRLATPLAVEACMAGGLDSLKFSFNNADAAQFLEVTQVKQKEFQKVLDNIKMAYYVRQGGNFKCRLYASSIRYDGEQFYKMNNAVGAIKPYVDEHYWLPLYGQAGLTAGENDTVPVAGNPGRFDCMRPPLPCWAVFTEGHITYDSRLSACCFDHDGRFDMGNLKELSFKEAWHSTAFQKLRKANLGGNVTGTACEKCVAYN